VNVFNTGFLGMKLQKMGHLLHMRLQELMISRHSYKGATLHNDMRTLPICSIIVYTFFKLQSA